MYRVSFQRAFGGKAFCISVLLVFLNLMVIGGNYLVYGGFDVIGVFSYSDAQSGSYIINMGVLPLVPFCASLAYDRKQGNISYYVIRSGERHYLFSKFLASLTSAGAVYLLGTAAFIGVISCFLPVYTNYGTGNGYEPFLTAGHPYIYLLVILINYWFTVLWFAAVGFVVSVFVKEPMAVYVFPMVIMLVLERFTEIVNVPGWLRPVGLLQGLYNLGTPLVCFAWKAIPVLLMVAICYLISAAAFHIFQLQNR